MKVMMTMISPLTMMSRILNKKTMILLQVFGYNQFSEEMKWQEIVNSKFNSCPPT